MFCPKCGSLMAPKDEKGKRYLACACGYSNKKPAAGSVKEVVQVRKPEGDFQALSEDPTSLPVTEEVCPKCGHMKAYWWTKQMRASDEPETKFLKCQQCKHTWRDRS